MKIRLAAPLQLDSVVDGEGLRMVIWFSGCSIHCPGCHNPETQDFSYGRDYEIDDIVNQIIQKKDLYDGITLSGGHPLEQPQACLELVQKCKQAGINIWLYSGWTYENIINKDNLKAILKECDVLVDGPFIMAQKALNVPFRGSSNQRVIDVQKSLRANKVILYEI